MKRLAWIGTVIGLVAVGGGLVFVAGRFARQEIAATTQASSRPHVTATRPPKDATEVSPVTAVIADIVLGGKAGVDEKTLASGLQLVRTRDNAPVAVLANSSGGGDDLVLKPAAPLELGTQYTFRVTRDLKTTDGQSFDPTDVTFTTAKQFAVSAFPAAFEKVTLPDVKLEQDAFTSLAIGPDGRLYAGTFAGMIHRYTINADGTLTPVSPVMTILQNNGGPRLLTGIAFDPKSTAENPILWVNHGQFAMKNNRPEGADDWTGKLSRLGGKELGDYEDVLVGLPRAYKDHLNFQIAFGPDGALYFAQGSNTSVGDADVKWGYRAERKLTASVLRLDVSKVPPPASNGLPPAPSPLVGEGGVGGSPDAKPANRSQNPSPHPLPQGEGEKRLLPFDVKTEDGGAYDPAAPNAPLTIHATGVRSAFKLLFHRNGHLYTGVNGAAGNEGNTPASPDGRVPAVRDIKQTTDDLLLKVTPGAYYGHPNPARGQYVLNGGNPTAAVDPQEITAYPVGTMPEKNWQPPAYVFGKNYSPNGLIDYKAPGSPLDGCILVTRYSDGKDILVLKLNEAGDVIETIAGLDGFTGLNAPLDLLQDPKHGNLYVAEYAGRQITLLRPIQNGKSPAAQRTSVAH
ncbi:MAG TPA: Ig-like domain-containing protein [Tepidisphaeraceae bacterium]|jgi:hypothetical protein